MAEKIETLGDRLRREGKFSLSQMFTGMRSRHEIACTFLALLELIRLNQARAVQEETYGEILIESAEGVVELVPPLVEEAPAGTPERDA